MQHKLIMTREENRKEKEEKILTKRKCLQVAGDLVSQIAWAHTPPPLSILPDSAPLQHLLGQLQFCSLHKAFNDSLPKPSRFTHRTKEYFLSGNEESCLINYLSWVPSCQPSWNCSSWLCAFSVSLPQPRPWWNPLVPLSWIPPLLVSPTAVLCTHMDLPLAWFLICENFKAGTIIAIFIPWHIHKNGPGDAHERVDS